MFNSTSTSQTITSLTNGTAYTFLRRWPRTRPAPAASPRPLNSVTPAGVPGVPTGVSGTSGNSQVSLSWSAPSNDGGSPITGYVITPYIGGSPQSTRTFDSSLTSQIITGLNNGTSYTFRVAAKNAVGTGSQSSASSSVTPSSTPTAPTIGTATAGNGEATVSWTAPTGGSGTIVRYYVSYYVNGVYQDVQQFDSDCDHADGDRPHQRCDLLVHRDRRVLERHHKSRVGSVETSWTLCRSTFGSVHRERGACGDGQVDRQLDDARVKRPSHPGLRRHAVHQRQPAV